MVAGAVLMSRGWGRRGSQTRQGSGCEVGEPQLDLAVTGKWQRPLNRKLSNWFCFLGTGTG